MSVLPSFRLDGRGMVVTGGGGHLGSAMALGLAEAGATVVICGRNEERLAAVVERAAGLEGRVVAFGADVSTVDGVRAVLDRVEREAGRCDAWVNNAYAGSTGRLMEATESQVHTTLLRGLGDVILATQEAALRMQPHGHGVIVNVASMYGLVSPQPDAYRDHPSFHNPPTYGAAKAGVIQFTRYAACHLARDGIRVNAVSPGPFPGGAAAEDALFVQRLAERVPLARMGRPSEIAGAVVFLVSDAASYVTGHNLVVDGGWTAW